MNNHSNSRTRLSKDIKHSLVEARSMAGQFRINGTSSKPEECEPSTDIDFDDISSVSSISSSDITFSDLIDLSSDFDFTEYLNNEFSPSSSNYKTENIHDILESLDNAEEQVIQFETDEPVNYNKVDYADIEIIAIDPFSPLLDYEEDIDTGSVSSHNDSREESQMGPLTAQLQDCHINRHRSTSLNK